MGTTTALQAIRVPQGSDSPNGPTQMTALANDLEQRAVMRFASAATRTSAFTAAGISPTVGMLTYRLDAPGLNGLEYWNSANSAWRVHGSYRDKATLGSSAASITLSNIPTYLSRVSLRLAGRCDAAATTSSVVIQIGGDTGTTYRHQVWFSQNQGAGGVGTNHGANSAISQSSAIIGYIPGAGTASASVFGALATEICGWDSPHVNYLSGTSQSGYQESTTNNIVTSGVWAYVGSFGYSSIKVFPSSGNFVAGTELSLVGTE